MTNTTSAEPYDYAIHSDFLIHWTGNDIEPKSDKDDEYEKDKDEKNVKIPKWYLKDRSSTECSVTKQYLKRLRDILKYGLWMTEEDIGTSVCNFRNQHGDCEECEKCEAGEGIESIARTCFTELKVSESRKHARKYGRLGIGVKRRFLFERSGRPVVYYQHYKAKDNGIQYCDQFFKSTASYNKSMLGFFKLMGKSGIRFDYYPESEWRIIDSDKLRRDKLIIDPRDTDDEEIQEYFSKLSVCEQNNLKYLIPLDGQLSMIIYPSLAVKNMAQKWMKDKPQGIGQDIYNEIKRINDIPDSITGRPFEGGNWPIELDLDACRNF